MPVNLKEGNKSMEDNKLYTTLFNAITDALREMDKLNIGSAKEILLRAQLTTEGMFIAKGEQQPEP